jgi:hypothetical protein
LEQVLPLSKVATKTQAFRGLEARNYASFDTLTGLPGHLRSSPIFSARLVEMSRKAVPFGQNGLQERVQPFRARHGFLQLLKKGAGIHIS